MLDFKIKIPKDLLRLDTPQRKFFQGIGTDTVRGIRKRTETEGLDSKGQAFKPYSQAYKEYRRDKGRSTKPNLSFTSRMLSAMAKGIRATNRNVKIILSGDEGNKASGNEEKGRTFFELSEQQEKSIQERLGNWMKRKNKLK